MRRIVSVMLVIALCISGMTINVKGIEVDGEITTRFADGGYIIESVTENSARLTGSKSGYKSYKYYESNGKMAWCVDIFGNFVYTGATSTCIASNISVTVYDTAWAEIARNSSESGNSAVGQVTMGRYSLGALVESKTVNLRLTCDANGNLS